MFRLFKKILSFLIVALAVALVLNLNIRGRPAREWALEIWHQPQVQKVYQTVRDRVMAVLRKDISIEDAFKPALPKDEAGKGDTSAAAVETPAQTKTIQLEKLSDEDRKALDKILEKAAK